MTNLRESLQHLSEVLPQLNKAADEAAKIVLEVEANLAKLNVGIEAKVLVRREKTLLSDRDTTLVSSWLAYRRVNGQFRIAVIIEKTHQFINVEDEQDEQRQSVSEVPWAECSRELKLQSFPKLPDLLDSIVQNTLAAKKELEEAQKAVRNILGAK